MDDRAPAVTGAVPADGAAPRPHRPARYADLTQLIDAMGADASPSARAEVAAETAAAVVRVGRSPDGTAHRLDLVDLADRVGIDTLAALWRDADPVSLPGVLWTLYVLRQWCHADADEVTRLWRAGEPLAPVDAVVAGVADFADPAAIRELSDAVLGGAYRGDFAVALERAAAFFRVMAAGRRTRLDAATTPDAASLAETSLADRNERAARSLRAAAAAWRAGTLH